MLFERATARRPAAKFGLGLCRFFGYRFAATRRSLVETAFAAVGLVCFAAVSSTFVLAAFCACWCRFNCDARCFQFLNEFGRFLLDGTDATCTAYIDAFALNIDMKGFVYLPTHDRTHSLSFYGSRFVCFFLGTPYGGAKPDTEEKCKSW